MVIRTDEDLKELHKQIEEERKNCSWVPDNLYFPTQNDDGFWHQQGKEFERIHWIKLWVGNQDWEDGEYPFCNITSPQRVFITIENRMFKSFRFE